MHKYTPYVVVNDFLNQWLPLISGKNQTQQYCQKHFDNNTLYNVVAIGKASVSMTVGLLGFLKQPPAQLLCISKTNHLDDELKKHLETHPEWTYLEAAHPVIKQSSLDAGKTLIQFLEFLEKDTPLIILISGGTSSLVEKLPMGISLEFLSALNEYLLASGLAIDEINQVRKRFSLIKDGRLISTINSNQIDVLYISDVANNDVSTIGSGLFKKSNYSKTVPLPSQFDVALPNFRRKELVAKKIKHHIIFDLEQALDLAKKSFNEKEVYCHPCLLFQSIDKTKAVISNVIKKHPKFDVYIFGGEATIELPKNYGKGGRNQHLALSFITELPDNHVFLSLGTDGTDGDTCLAGAWIDSSVKRYKQEIDKALHSANSFKIIEQLGLGINTGATGSNVMDIMLVFKV